MKDIGWNTGNQGSYTVEAALTLTIFMVSVMSLLSIFGLMKIEGEVRAAINKTAMEISRYSYAVDQLTPLKEEAKIEVNEKLRELTAGLSDALLPDIEEAVIAEKNKRIVTNMVKRNFNMENPDDWLKKHGVVNGLEGIDFSSSAILEDGQTISVRAEYKVKIDRYGMIPKSIDIRNCAKTYALLPYEYRYSSFLDGRRKKKSPWHESNFARGRYFVNKVRRKNPKWVVEQGHGIDLYNDEKGIYAEVYSMNIFASSYSSCSGDKENPDSYSMNEEGVIKQLDKYAEKFNRDIEGLGDKVKMEDGSTKNKKLPEEKRIIIIVPEEAEKDKSKKEALSGCAKKIKDNHGVTIEYIYKEKVFL